MEFSLLSFKWGQKRSSSDVSDLRSPRQWFLDAVGSVAGKKAVNKKTALSHAAVWRAVILISETIGSLSFDIHRRLPNGGRELALDHPAFRLVHSRASDWLSSQQFRQTMEMIKLLYGASLAVIERDNDGFAVALHVVKPDIWRVQIIDRKKWFRIQGVDGLIPDEDVIHIMGPSLNGYEGLSPIEYHRQVVALGLSASDYNEKFYQNGAHVRGVLKFQGSLTNDRVKEISNEWDSSYGGVDKFKTAVLHSGADYQVVSLSQRDAQTIEMLNLNVEDVARMFGLTTDRLMSAKQTSYSSIEQNSMLFAQDCIRPKAKYWEDEYEYKLWGGNPEYKATLDLNSLLRGDTRTRMDYYWRMWMMGAMNPNEIRAKENLNPRDEQGDQYMTPANMQSEEMVEIMEKLAQIELKTKGNEQA